MKFTTRKLMKRSIILYLLFLVTFISPLLVEANNDDSEDIELDNVIRVFIDLRNCYDNDESIDINEYATRLKDYDLTIDNDKLQDIQRIHDESELWNRLVEKVDSIRSDNLRGGTKIKAARFYVKPGESVKYSFRANRRTSVAAMPEAKGLVTMRIHAHNRYGYDNHFDDQEKFHQGKTYRSRVMQLPEQPTTVDVEILNRSKKEISVVMIRK